MQAVLSIDARRSLLKTVRKEQSIHNLFSLSLSVLSVSQTHTQSKSDSVLMATMVRSSLTLFFFFFFSFVLVALGRAGAQDNADGAATESTVGFCESENRFSGGLDCTQFVTGTAEEAKEACAQGLTMPSVAGSFTEGARCPLYLDKIRLGGECERQLESGLVVRSVLEFDEDSPFASCSGLENVCTTFIQGQWKPASACGGGGDSDSSPDLPAPSETEPTSEEEKEVGGVPANSPELAAEVETLADGFDFTEGPIWIPSQGADPSLPPSTLLFSDMRRNVIYSWSNATGLGVYTNESMGTNGKAFDLDGQLIGFRSGPRNVARGADPKSATVLAGGYEGKSFNSPNDGAVSPKDGSIFFSDPIWGILARPEEEQELDLHGVFRIDADGNVVTLELNNLAMPNGIAISEEGDTLFVSDTGGLPIHPNPKLASDEPPPTLTAWALEEGSKVNQPPVPIWSREDLSDGMCLNERGLWSTRSGMGPSIYGPKGLVLTNPSTGQEIGHIEIEDPTNVECHTEEEGVLYVTTASKVVKVTLLE